MTQVNEKTNEQREDDYRLALHLADDVDRVGDWVRSIEAVPGPVSIALARLYFAAGIASAHLLTEHVTELAQPPTVRIAVEGSTLNPRQKPKFWDVAVAVGELERSLLKYESVDDDRNPLVMWGRAVVAAWRKVSP